jgi:hypothetical protein
LEGDHKKEISKLITISLTFTLEISIQNRVKESDLIHRCSGEKSKRGMKKEERRNGWDI